MPRTVTDSQLAAWSDVYKTILNTDEYRDKLISRNCTTIEIDPKGNYVKPKNMFQRGSIQVVFNDQESHWMSYWKTSKGYILFDPAESIKGDPIYPLGKAHLRSLKRLLGEYKLFENQYPQQVGDDTWCQTWSLAMLDANYQDSVRGIAKSDSQEARMHLISNIVIAYAEKIMSFGLVKHLSKEDQDAWYHVYGYVNLKSSFYRFYSDDVPVTVTPNARVR